MRAHEIITEVKQRLDAKCWKGKHKEGTKIKDGVRVNNCVPNESVEEGSISFTDPDQKINVYYATPNQTRHGKKQVVAKNIAYRKLDAIYDLLKQKYNADPANVFWAAAEAPNMSEGWSKSYKDTINCSNPKGFSQKAHCAGKKKDEAVDEGHGRYYCSTDKKWKTRQGPKQTRNTESAEIIESLDQQFDAIEEMVNQLAEHHGVDPEVIWEDFESVDDDELLDESAAWRRSAGKSKSGGLNAKGVASYRRENPGSKLQTAVTTKPSKLKKGSKAAKRRKSFCARMGGVKGPMKKPNGKPTRKALALRKWNC